MAEAESLNFKCGVIGDSSKKNGTFFSPNLDDIFLFINKLNLSENDKQTLAKKAKKIPHGSLINFTKNYMCYLKKTT